MSGHRAIVTAGSPVFHAMLYGNMKESNEKEVPLPSVDTETFKALLSFTVQTSHNLNASNVYTQRPRVLPTHLSSEKHATSHTQISLRA